MEHIHGIDVSWMTHGSPKEKPGKPTQRRNTLPQAAQHSPPPSPQASPPAPPAAAPAPAPAQTQTNGQRESTVATATATTPAPKPIPPARPGFSRSNSADKSTNGLGSSPQRRGSWFSNISSKFSSSPASSPPQTNSAPPNPAEISVPKANPAKNAVLQHAARHEGEGPYTPAPPRSGQAGILQVFRRLSSSAGNAGPAIKGHHGLVERKILNVDPHRPRCPLSDLNQAKLRRVSFCVDVEIAPMPKYADPDAIAAAKKAGDKAPAQRRKLTEKGEGDVLKRPKSIEEEKGEESVKEVENKVSEKVGDDNKASADAKETPDAGAGKAGGDLTRKKEKKKKSEEERKARKEKKRKLAEANGSIPMEIHVDSDSSDASTPRSETAPRAQLTPTTNPVRIYRRCCQLRETPILKKITEQLSVATNFSAEQGLVERLDLTGYWLQLPDLVTLGDYLAVVPVREVIMENAGLTDEGLRVILSGLLAAKRPERKHRRHLSELEGLANQGGVVERLVLKNNKIGPEGWKHLCLFVYMCRSLKCLDLSSIAFPRSARVSPPQKNHHLPLTPLVNGMPHQPMSICQLLSQSIGERLGGATLELLNLGDTGLSTAQLDTLIDGIVKCGVKRLGLAHNDLDSTGVSHVARYLRSGLCEGLDLGGNDLREQLEVLSDAMTPQDPLWALSLADCNLKPSSLCKLLPKLAKLANFRFIDLSHNHELFTTEPSALSLLRRYLPKMEGLKRIHLADVALTSEQAIALAEILPEIKELAHINLLQNPEITKLADARTEEAQEEACALYASLLAATRVSTSIVAVDIDVPTSESGEIVRAMARQVVAYCLRNMERVSLSGAALSVGGDAIAIPKAEPEYPDVIQHLVGHDVMIMDESDDAETAPDDDYVIGGTGVVKALACCLKNRGDESRRQSGEFVREVEGGDLPAVPRPNLPHGKAKDMSKHLLVSARKIRHRLQPSLQKAKRSGVDTQAYHRLIFLDNTLDGIIKRFEDEFPDTREAADSAISVSPPVPQVSRPHAASLGSNEGEPEGTGSISEAEEETEIRPSSISRSNSVISLSSKGLTNEEGRVLRAGHKFRSGWIKHYNLLSGVEELGGDPKQNHILHEMLADLDDDHLNKKVEDKGIIRVFQEDRDYILQQLKSQDPEHWARFIESQEMARANVSPTVNGIRPDNATAKPAGPQEPAVAKHAAAEDVAVTD